MNKILDLQISYPDFQLGQIIDPEQVDTNNLQIVNKMNSLILAINTLTQGTTGASEITIATIPEFASAKTIQQALNQIATFAKNADTTTLQKLAELVQKNTEQDGRLTNVETKNTQQDTRLGAIETLNETQNQRLTRVESKDTEQDSRLVAVESKNAEQDKTLGTHTTQIEALKQADVVLTESVVGVQNKDKEQDTRISNIEVREELDQAFVEGVSSRVDINTTDITLIRKELGDIAQINPSAEIVDARRSTHTGQVFDTLGKRFDSVEIPMATDFTPEQRAKYNFRVVAQDEVLPWENEVKLANLNIHNADAMAHPNMLAQHELDAESHADIRRLIGNVLTLPTQSKEIVGAIQELKEYLDANDVDLASKINVLLDYKYPPEGITHPKDLPSGNWYLRSANNPWDDVFYIDVGVNPVGGYKMFMAYNPFGTEVFTNRLINNVWGKWEKQATTTKTDILLTPDIGYTMVTQKNYQINNVVYVNIVLKKSDDSQFTTGNGYKVATLPQGVRPNIITQGSGQGGFTSGVMFSNLNCMYATDGGVYVVVKDNGLTMIRLSGVIVL